MKSYSREFYELIDATTQMFFILWHQSSLIYNHYYYPRVISKKIYYPINFASMYGGARIVMKNSKEIKSINSILDDSFDKYMYTNGPMPIKIIIGLNEEIAIESIILQSFEMYSRITKEFQVEGKFTLEDKKWAHLGTF